MPSATGFTKLGEEELVRAFHFRVVRARFRAADGEEFSRDVVRHPGAVAVVPLHDDGTVTLVRQFRAALDVELLEIPAGLRDVAGEPDAATAARELAEEAGLAAGVLEHLVTFVNSPGFCDEDVAVFLATDLRDVAHDRQGTEEHAMTLERMPLQAALSLVAHGGITDAKTIIGLTLVARREL